MESGNRVGLSVCLDGDSHKEKGDSQYGSGREWESEFRLESRRISHWLFDLEVRRSGFPSRSFKRSLLSAIIKLEYLHIEGLSTVIIKTDFRRIVALIFLFHTKSGMKGIGKAYISFNYLFGRSLLSSLFDYGGDGFKKDTGRFVNNGDRFSWRKKGYGELYIDHMRISPFISTLESFLVCLVILILLLFAFWIKMSQGQLVGDSGALRNGESARKKMKISVPHFNNSDLIKGYSKTLIGRCMNPEEQNIKSLVVTMPKIWNMEERVVGTDLGLRRFQFDFDVEEDTNSVLQMQPFPFDYWMVSLVRCQPRTSINYPSEITFWIKVLGVPLEFWETSTFQNIGDALGEIKEIDLDYGRVRVAMDGFKELIFEMSVDFNGGEFYEGVEVPVSLRYEKLFGYCRLCFSLCHNGEKCPLNPKCGDKAAEKREDSEGRLEDRARSYKGVILHGNIGQHGRGREKREYQGKGKGKLMEEDNLRNRGSRRELSRFKESRAKSPEGSSNAREVQTSVQENQREEGEIGSMVKSQQEEEKAQAQTSPSPSFLVELSETQASPVFVPAIPINDFLGSEVHQVVPTEVRLSMALVELGQSALQALHDGVENNKTSEDFSQEPSVEEIERDARTQDDDLGEMECEKQMDEEEGKAKGPEEMAKKQNSRRRTFKLAPASGASNKLKTAQMFASKRSLAKAGNRFGDLAKPGEEKGSSHPKPDFIKH
ncbi:hypothetical protein N665_0912s0003 [Sinapis alba]|nr:hypothetical protein N665_0912s0003 [Sinapis alba]